MITNQLPESLRSMFRSLVMTNVAFALVILGAVMSVNIILGLGLLFATMGSIGLFLLMFKNILEGRIHV